MLADRQKLVERLRHQGPAVAGQHWAVLTAEAHLASFSRPLPYVFPGLLRDAERLCQEAERSVAEAGELYAHAGATWNQLLGPKHRQAS